MLETIIFKATMIEWHTHVAYPLCKLEFIGDQPSLGSILDSSVLVSSIMKDYGFDENSFP